MNSANRFLDHELQHNNLSELNYISRLLGKVISNFWPSAASRVEKYDQQFLHVREPCSLQGVRPQPDSTVGRQLASVYKRDYDQWLRSFDMKPCWETHKDCLELHIWHGYRPNPSTFAYCLKSMFYPSNETLNVWTHLIPLLIMLWRIYTISVSLENPTEDITYPFWIFSFGCCVVLFCSSIAHLFNCYSATVQEFCFCLDYGAIPFYGLSIAISFQHYICPFKCFGFHSDFFPLNYMTTMYFVTLIGTVLTCWSRYPSCPMRYLWRFGPYAVCFVIGGYPCFVRCFVNAVPSFFAHFDIPSVANVNCHLGVHYVPIFVLHLLIYVVAGLLLMTRFPEKWFPGRFDIVGHSHQWFHLCVAAAMYLQHYMVESSMKEAIMLRKKNALDEALLDINRDSTLLSLAFFIVTVACVIYRTSTSVGLLIERERKQRTSTKMQ